MGIIFKVIIYGVADLSKVLYKKMNRSAQNIMIRIFIFPIAIAIGWFGALMVEWGTPMAALAMQIFMYVFGAVFILFGSYLIVILFAYKKSSIESILSSLFRER
ncbi:MAG: hypothetical protein HRT89_05410 [Lentisphaeria bacterium]|nr:hypothetical protein [Lentisphaeria bacterium]NQZ67489.1 hypothetical protein [Lentisphaeria bacterium]